MLDAGYWMLETEQELLPPPFSPFPPGRSFPAATPSSILYRPSSPQPSSIQHPASGIQYPASLPPQRADPPVGASTFLATKRALRANPHR
jgi:hypothetical protein